MKQIQSKYLRILLILVALSIFVNLLAFTNFYLNYREAKLTSKVTASGLLSLTILPSGVCVLDLSSEWNLISLCATPSNRSIENVTSSIAGDFDYILKWNASDQSFLLWSPYAVNPKFDEFEVNSSYFIHINASSSDFSINGSTNSDFNISLISGFNTPSWPYEFNSTVSAALASINNSYTYILKWNASDQSYLLWSVYSATKPFDNFTVGEGQFINVNTTSITLQYNRSALGP